MVGSTKSPAARWYIINNDKSNESDEWALNNGFVSVVPVKFDLTNHEVIEKIKSWNL